MNKEQKMVLRMEIKSIINQGLSLEYALNNLNNEFTPSTIKKYYKIFKKLLISDKK